MINFDSFKGIIFLCVIFIPLERLFFFKKQSIFRKGFFTDIIYFFTGNIISNLCTSLIIVIALFFKRYLPLFSLRDLLYQCPLIMQFILMLLIGEIGYYLSHRMLHEIPFLWRFHSIHHSTKYLDWLATTRVHPFDQIFTKICQFLPFYYLEFSANLLTLYLLWSASIAFFIHSNIRLNFGIINYIIVTPNLHQWHHDREVINVNYSAQIPLLDLIFNTWYLPSKIKVNEYGIKEKIPNNYLSQFMYPFLKR